MDCNVFNANKANGLGEAESANQNHAKKGEKQALEIEEDDVLGRSQIYCEETKGRSS